MAEVTSIHPADLRKIENSLEPSTMTWRSLTQAWGP